MDSIKAMSFVGARSGKFADEYSKESLKRMVDTTGCNTVIFVLGALQDTPQSEHVDYKHVYMPTDEELNSMIQCAKYLGLKVILKPVVNCKDGTWRAFIDFFEKDIICEPKWSKWFASYTEFQLHYAKIAMENKCDMLIIGTEMVKAEHREEEWRDLIAKVRKVYSGMLSYTADKYYEDNVKWWDAVDIISSSGYYPAEVWEEELDRIEELTKEYNKPFFFAEVGCKACKGSASFPNLWAFQGTLDLGEQEMYYAKMIKAFNKREFVNGFGVWEWNYRMLEEPEKDKGYEIDGKPACTILKQYWKENLC